MMKQWVVLISLGLLVLCSEPPEAIVKELAQQRWSALLQGNTSQAYALYTKAFQDTTPLQQFENSIRGWVYGKQHRSWILSVRTHNAK